MSCLTPDTLHYPFCSIAFFFFFFPVGRFCVSVIFIRWISMQKVTELVISIVFQWDCRMPNIRFHGIFIACLERRTKIDVMSLVLYLVCYCLYAVPTHSSNSKKEGNRHQLWAQNRKKSLLKPLIRVNVYVYTVLRALFFWHNDINTAHTVSHTNSYIKDVDACETVRIPEKKAN